MKTQAAQEALWNRYIETRSYTEQICQPLEIEDYVVQPVGDVSPPKWHLGHTTWFFETFILKEHLEGYKEYHPSYNFVFNSYYEAVGARVIRTDRGNLSRPAVKDIYAYRHYVDRQIQALLSKEVTPAVIALFELGINHEQQHQELLYTDIKYILGHNPLFPAYDKAYLSAEVEGSGTDFLSIDGGMYEIGHSGSGFCFDNELGRHQVYTPDFDISQHLVTNGAYLDFIVNGGYKDFNLWHSEGWDWVKANDIRSPLYWHLIEGAWYQYEFPGLQPLDLDQPVTHISYYEAYAYANWKGCRLPSEFEWEIAADKFQWGLRWEWTESAYLAYPGFKKAGGAIGEYNGKFMVNQKVLRGASAVTAPGHSRKTYRNFFQTPVRGQFTGIRLAR